MESLLLLGDSLSYYKDAPPPTCIISDGPYGVDGFDGDDKNHFNLDKFYLPHIENWSLYANAQTTLWFWCTEVGWATVHPILVSHGWIFKGCNIWDKGIRHISGNCNGKTMRKFPVVTEVCVQYVREEEFFNIKDKSFSAQQWIRSEWDRTGLGLQAANTACGLKSAASRKYLTKDKLWYFPPEEEFIKMVEYANEYGDPKGKPYFSINQSYPVTKGDWSRLRHKFNFEYNTTNVWSVPTVTKSQRFKSDNIYHPNQKPLELMTRIIKASTDEGDCVWEPFAGSASASVAAKQLNRVFWAVEKNKKYYNLALKRLGL